MIVASLAVTILLLKTYAVMSMRVVSWVGGGPGSGSSIAANAPWGKVSAWCRRLKMRFK